MTISVTTTHKAAESVKADALVVFVPEGKPFLHQFPEQIQKQLTQAAKNHLFTGAWGSSALIPAADGMRTQFIGLIGLGGEDALPERQVEGVRRAAGALTHEMRRHILRNVAVIVPDIEDAVSFATATLEGMELANYRFAQYRHRLAQEQERKAIVKALFVGPSSLMKDLDDELQKTIQILEGVRYTRNLVNQPASHMSPSLLVESAKKIARQPRIKLRVFNRKEAEKRKFTAFLAVARGSTEEPYVIHLTYTPAKKNRSKRKIILVGKGVTFDSGGLSLKPAPMMENMKADMGGAATVLGVFSIISKLDLNCEVHGIIPACENMPSGNAYRPGDIITAKNGKTIEVLNTDAEGRIILADALVYAVEQNPDAIIDLATLTGACVVALGDTYAGLWSNDEELREEILSSAHTTGEGIAPLPLPDEYRQTIQSSVADLRNVASLDRVGGAITAALFLREFINKTPWAHLDVAGPVYAEKSLLPYYTPGATGFGVRTMVKYLQAQ